MKNTDAYRNYTIVAYCTIGYRSGKFVEKLQKRVFRHLILRGEYWVGCTPGVIFTTKTGLRIKFTYTARNGNILPRVTNRYGNAAPHSIKPDNTIEK